MGTVFLQILPLALAAIAPTMIGLVVLFLSDDRGLVKALAFILGKYSVYVLWGVVSLELVGHISSTSLGGTSAFSESIFLIFGLLLLILAMRSFLGEDDPDAPPPKIMTILDKMGPVKLFGVGLVLSLMQFRFIALVLVGAAVIEQARLSTTENLISVLFLALLMVWPMLIPVVVFLVLGERREAAMKSMRTWLTRNQRVINVVVLGVFGILLLILGLISIFG
ncbi:MAG TPA: GAP family protein [Ktedonobacteraceae bacterium]